VGPTLPPQSTVFEMDHVLENEAPSVETLLAQRIDRELGSRFGIPPGAATAEAPVTRNGPSLTLLTLVT
jgi:hypothetical protein